MARPLRIEFAGAVYHVTSRGNARQDIVRDDLDRKKRASGLGLHFTLYGDGIPEATGASNGKGRERTIEQQATHSKWIVTEATCHIQGKRK
jgi:hypothetical protein